MAIGWTPPSVRPIISVELLTKLAVVGALHAAPKAPLIANRFSLATMPSRHQPVRAVLSTPIQWTSDSKEQPHEPLFLPKEYTRTSSLTQPAVSTPRTLIMPVITLAAASLIGWGALPVLSRVGTFYSAAAISMPYLCAAMTAIIKGICSDVFAQCAVERTPRLDTMRTLAFASFGGVYLGLFNQWKYSFFYTQLFGKAATATAIAAKVGVDMAISAPFLYFPTYFVVKGLFAGTGPLASLREYISPAGASLLRRYWMVWLPVETIMWVLIPAHLRIAFLCAVSLLWQVALSTLSNRRPAEPVEGRRHSVPLMAAAPGSADEADERAQQRVADARKLA